MAHRGPGEAAARPASCTFRLGAACLAPSPVLRSPHSSLLSTQQNKLFPGKVVPLEKMFSHASEALAWHVGSDQPGQGLGPTLHSHSFQSVPCQVIKGNVWSEQLLSVCSTAPFGCG